MPNQPKTPQRAFRVPDEEWLPAMDAASARRLEREDGETLSSAIRRFLRLYGAGVDPTEALPLAAALLERFVDVEDWKEHGVISAEARELLAELGALEELHAPA